MNRNALALLAGGLLCAALPASAHHSFAAEYDAQKPIKITGTVTKVEWMNPHIYYYVDSKDDSGKVTNFAVEGGTPNQLYRQGWRKDSLRIGDTITVSGFRAKNAENVGNGRSITLPDGRELFSGGSAPGSEGGKQ